MPFGQSSGPPATARQVAELLELLQAAGHADFRDARGPMGFTQRQAAGTFTRDEAEELIDQLQEAEHAADLGASTPEVAPPPRPSKVEQDLARFTTEQLAAEVQRRGWVVLEP